MSIIIFFIEVYLALLILRIFIELFTVSAYNPISRWVLNLTKPIVAPVQKILPTHGRVDWATLLVLLVIQAVLLIWRVWISLDTFPHLGGLLIWSFGALSYLSIRVIFWLLIIHVIFSWVALMNHQSNAMQQFVDQIAFPLLRPLQQFIPVIAGLDFSAVALLIGLNLVNHLLVSQIMALGISLIY